MSNRQAIQVGGALEPPGGLLMMRGSAAPVPSARVVESRAGRIVVRHEDGYVFVFQVHDLDELHMDLEEVTWSTVGAPPDAQDLELQARSIAEVEARERGWLT